MSPLSLLVRNAEARLRTYTDGLFYRPMQRWRNPADREPPQSVLVANSYQISPTSFLLSYFVLRTLDGC
jgi:hypothetical protein